ncbi:MAG: DUF885 domain-containing protein [Lachnospiraceae bacterium]|nr:DUF885 domain-containing protein [Lachnospiraceae bacterium]
MKRHTPISRKQLLFICCFFAAFIGITLFLFGYRRDEKLFSHISSELFVQEMKSSTLNMHYTIANPTDFGIYNYEVLLPCYQKDAYLSGQASTENLLKRFTSLDSSKLTPQDAYTLTLLTRSLDNSLHMNAYPYYEEPLSPKSGMQSQLPILLAEYTFRNKQDIEDYLELLDQTDEYFASLLTFEQEKAAVGLLMAECSLEDVCKQCDTIVTSDDLDAGTHFLQTTFLERLQPLLEAGLLSKEEASQYVTRNNTLLQTVMLPAYITLSDGLFLLKEQCTPLAGLAAKPDGKAYYEHLMISETGSYRSIADIKTLLTTQLQKEYQAIRTLFNQNPTLIEQYTSSCYTTLPFQNADAMLNDLIMRMQNDFPSLDLNQYVLPSVQVKNVSPSLENYCAPAFYLTPPIDASDSNVIYINQKDSPKGLELYTTLAHEGYPGHLYQTVYSNRSFLINEENNARQLLWYGGYLEGWALYVEFISYDYISQFMKEQNQEQNALCVQIEKHNRSLQLCLYSLIDIMIHYENASYSDIAAFLEAFGITSADSVRAIYTYITEEPCNYLKYYLGYLEILELKKHAKAQWKDSYSDYYFHKFYLDAGPSDFSSLGEYLKTFYPLPQRID